VPRASSLTRIPDGFLWGAATSAYQIEGSPLADGAGPSIWHRFAHTPGRIRNGDTGDVACDHYHRYADDVALMRHLGLTAYRFSVSWPRVVPTGRGRANPAGLAFYDRLVDALLASNIQPFVTLYHWDLPAALDDAGGWLNRDIANWFADYAALMFRALDDRVPMWATLNEPWVVTDGGYLHGTLAPGHRSLFEPPLAAHKLLRAHAAAVTVYRGSGRHQIGLVVNLEPKYPASERARDVAAAARADAYINRQFLDPVFLGTYPPELAEIFGEAWPNFPADEVASIGQPLDFLGINYYTRGVMRHDRRAYPLRAVRVAQREHVYTDTGWEVFPQGLTDVLRWVTDRYAKVPLYITENGAAFYDPPMSDGATVMQDPLRVAYLRAHIRAMRAAIGEGADVRGYFVWSLLDNFEWSSGFSRRFGLYHVDYATQHRTLKESGRVYRDMIRKMSPLHAPHHDAADVEPLQRHESH